MLETLFQGRALRDDAADDGENPAEAPLPQKAVPPPDHV